MKTVTEVEIMETSRVRRYGSERDHYPKETEIIAMKTANLSESMDSRNRNLMQRPKSLRISRVRMTATDDDADMDIRMMIFLMMKNK